ncbi:MAG: amidohydrolase family protein [Bacteroidetes bacterium]|nr:amidohydrolase family protein [Bacteroidota bacterium]
MRKLTADWIFPVDGPAIANGVLIVDESGKILALEKRENQDFGALEYHKGSLVPGFVNTHCHLELSHMLGKVDTGTGLIPFIVQVVTKRNVATELIAEAIERANQEMLDNGIVALGDISNAPDTFMVKAQGKMRYYTFIELFDFLQDAGADKAFHDWKLVYDQLELAPGSAKSMVPHAPYSVSPSLFEKINAFNGSLQQTISIHNQETPPEMALFMDKSGDFIDFYGSFDVALDAFQATGQASIYYALKHMAPGHRTLFVHNTLTSRADVLAAQAWSPHTYWATCPNANLYIENRLPNYQVFLDSDARVTIGTDSLTSNWQLSILEELKTISRYQSYVPFEAMLRWATLNGAQALGFADTLGSFTIGKTPGVVLLENVNADGGIKSDTRVRRLL